MGVVQLSDWGSHGIRVANGTLDSAAHQLAESDERIVVDLHVGDRFQRNGGQWIEMPKPITLKPGECVRLRAAERLTVPSNAFGMICSRASLAADGLYVSNLKVDPLFNGWLEIAVFNASRDRIRIAPGMAFASLFFVTVDGLLTNPVNRLPTETRAVSASAYKQRFWRVAPFAATAIVSVGGSLSANWIWGMFH